MLAAGENLVLAVLVVPLGQRGGHMHLLDDVAPANPGVVRAEGDLAFLSGIRDDALLRAPEIVVEQVLEPHSRNKQEVPPVLPAFLDIVASAVFAHLAVAL